MKFKILAISINITTLFFFTLYPQDAMTQNVANKTYRKWCMRPGVNFALWDTYTIGSHLNGLSTSTNQADIGLDFGYELQTSNKLHTTFFLGLAYSQSYFEMKYSLADYVTSSSVDVDGDSYERHYSKMSISQGAWVKELSIPLSASFSHPFSNRVSIYVNIGGRLNLNVDKTTTSATGSSHVYGVYPQYDNLIMDETWGYNGFGDVIFSDRNMDDNIKTNTFTADVFGELGVRYRLGNTSPLSIELGINYIQQVGNTFKSCSHSNSDIESNNLVYPTLSGMQVQEHMTSLTRTLNKSRRSGMLIHFGMIIDL
jgi:hypothetical protein